MTLARPVNTAARQPLHRLLPLYVVVFMGFIGYSLMITVFTPMLLRSDRAMLPAGTMLSTRTILLGLLLCLYPLGQFIGSPILGSLSDRFGRRPILLVSLAATTACYVLISLAITVDSLMLLAIASMIAGLAEANIVTAQSAIADVIPPEQRNRYFGYIYMAVSLAYIIGPLGGGKLTDSKLVSWFSDATPFWAVFLLLALTLLAVLLGFRETKAPGGGEARARESLASLPAVFTDRRLRRFYGINFLLYLAIFGFFRSYPMYLVDEFRLDVSAVSEFVAWVGLPIVLVNLWLTGFLSGRLPIKTMTIASGLLTGLFMIAIILPRRGGPLAAAVPGRRGAGGLPPLLRHPAFQRNRSGRKGRAMGNNQAIQVGAEALSGLAAGLLAALIVKLLLMVLGAVSIFAALLVALLL